jgi:hypothetical protein
MSNYLKIKEYQIHFVNNLPYKLGSSFDENNINLELKEQFDDIKVYRSYRYSELILFGTIFEPECYLWFGEECLLAINYKIENKYFEIFKEAINSELPDGYKLQDDPLDVESLPTIYFEDIMICLKKLNKNHFILKVQYHGMPQ